MPTPSSSEPNHLASFLDQMSDLELMNLVKQEAFSAVPADISVALRSSPDLWYRTIVSIVTDINEQLSRKKATFLAGNMTQDEVNTYNSWRTKAISVKSKLDIRITEARALRKQANIEQSKRINLAKFHILHAAVSAHRAAMTAEDFEATAYDLSLWKVLSDIDLGLYDNPEGD